MNLLEYIAIAMVVSLILGTIFVKPLWGIFAILIADILVPVFTSNLILFGILCGSLMMATGLGCIIKRYAQRSLHLWKKDRIGIYFISFLILSVIYALFGLFKGNSILLVLTDFFHFFFEIGLMYFIAVNVFDSKENIAKFIQGFIFITFTLSILIVLLKLLPMRLIFRGYNTFVSMEDSRLILLHSYPTLYLVFLIPIYFSYNKWRTQNIIVLGSIISLSILLIATLKRTYWISSLLALFCALFFMKKNMIRKISVTLITLFLVITICCLSLIIVKYEAMASVSDNIEMFRSILELRIKSIFQYDLSSSTRGLQYRDAINYIINQPFGYGLGSKFRTIGRVAIPGQFVGFGEFHYIHNVFMHYTLQMGIIFSSLYFVIIFVTIRNGIYMFNNDRYGYPKDIIVGIILVLIATIFNGLTTVSSNTFFISLMIGLMTSTRRYCHIGFKHPMDIPYG